MKTAEAARESMLVESDNRQLGRCIYCDQRCDSTATFHDYCRIEYEDEEQENLENRFGKSTNCPDRD